MWRRPPRKKDSLQFVMEDVEENRSPGKHGGGDFACRRCWKDGRWG